MTKQTHSKTIQPAKWEVREPPPDVGDRVSHFYLDSRDGANGWHIIGASRRGKMHEHDGAFREDALDIEVEAGWHLIAVADGAGAHHLSRVGSNVAVRTAVEVMSKAVTGAPTSESVARGALQDALTSAWETLRCEAESRQVAFRDLSTTLLLLMHHPRKGVVGVAQIGDGLIAVQFENSEVGLLGEPMPGEYVTNFDCSRLPAKTKVAALSKPVQCFFVMTDGISDDLYPPQERLPLLTKALAAVLTADDPQRALCDLIGYSRIGSFGDRTLVVLCQPEALLNPQLDFGSPEVRRMPVYFVIGCGDSMAGAPIQAVEQGIQLLHNELLNAPTAVEMVHLSVITFGNGAEQIVPLTAITEFSPPALKARGSHDLGAGLWELARSIKAEILRSSPNQKGDYQAIAFLMSDSEPTDDWQSALDELRATTSGLLGNIIALGCGDRVNTGVLKQITDSVLLMTDVTPDNLRAYFRWESQPKNS
jgi:uncharacterized protein YegL/serine/threonine protein phosphatase PrpC